ncbi:homoserine dehydrogenase, partial [Listeria monocytogenes]|nr:homoserine dehydrogenase [Listeria monocytogenes]
ADAGVGFDKILQHPYDDFPPSVVIVTHSSSQAQLEQAIARVKDEPEMQMLA